MDTSSEKDIWWFLLTFWPSIVVALAVYGGGVTANRIAGVFVPAAKDYLTGKTADADPKWPLTFRLWAATRTAHPFFVGGSFAFVPGLPHPDFISSQVSAVLWFAFAGMMNGQVHMLVDAMSSQVQKVVGSLAPAIRTRLGLRPTTVPPGPPEAAAPAASDKPPSDPPPPEAA